MSRSLSELGRLAARVSDGYAERFAIARNRDWYLLKLQEELGELTAEYLRSTGRGRLHGADQQTVSRAMADEAADVLATPVRTASTLRKRSSASGLPTFPLKPTASGRFCTSLSRRTTSPHLRRADKTG